MSILAIDTSSPVVSVAAAAGDRLAQRTCPQRGSSARLIEMIDGTLGELGLRIGGLNGIVALAGPGSFTGLRIGLATALGLHQATGVPAAAVPTLQVMGAVSPLLGTVGAAVDALRGEWFVQRFESDAAGWPQPLTPPAILGDRELSNHPASSWVSWGDGPPSLAGRCCEAPPLAALATRLAMADPPTWSADSLLHPLYLRSAPAHRPAS